MGRTRFRICIGLIAFAHLAAASELGAILGFAAIWAVIIALIPLGIAAAMVPGLGELDLPSWTPQAILGAVALAIVGVAARLLRKADAARRAGRHDAARRNAVLGLSVASAPTCFILSVKALADAWP